MWHWNSLTFETHMTYTCVYGRQFQHEWHFFDCNPQQLPVPGGGPCCWEVVAARKLIVWSKGCDVRGHVWAGLSEALTFNLSLEKLTLPTVLKEGFFWWRGSSHVGVRPPWQPQKPTAPKRDRSRGPFLVHERDSGGGCHSAVERREKVGPPPAQKDTWT